MPLGTREEGDQRVKEIGHGRDSGRWAPNGDEAVSSGEAAGVSGGYNITFNYIIRGRGRDITVRAEIEDENIDIRKRYSTVREKEVKNTKNKKKKKGKERLPMPFTPKILRQRDNFQFRLFLLMSPSFLVLFSLNNREDPEWDGEKAEQRMRASLSRSCR